MHKSFEHPPVGSHTAGTLTSLSAIVEEWTRHHCAVPGSPEEDSPQENQPDRDVAREG